MCTADAAATLGLARPMGVEPLKETRLTGMHQVLGDIDTAAGARKRLGTENVPTWTSKPSSRSARVLVASRSRTRR
jgi:hypothetical protein